jgi:ketosteroid isomerase-like protein
MLLCAIGLSAQPPSKSVAEQELLKIESEWMKAYLQSDSATMNRLEGEDMIISTPSSLPSRFKSINKSRSFERRTEADKLRWAAAKRTLEKTQVRLLGDIGIINAIEVEVSRDEKGAEKTTKEYYTSVWAKRKGAWQCLSAQFTEIPEANWGR